MSDSKVSQSLISWDYVGILLSFLCLVHCIFLPFLISALPLVGLEIFENEIIHKVLAVGISIVSLFAFISGVRLHKKHFVFILAFTGLFFVLSAVFYAGENWGEAAEKQLTVLGGCILISAHIANRTFCQKCLKCNQTHEEECSL